MASRAAKDDEEVLVVVTNATGFPLCAEAEGFSPCGPSFTDSQEAFLEHGGRMAHVAAARHGSVLRLDGSVAHRLTMVRGEPRYQPEAGLRQEMRRLTEAGLPRWLLAVSVERLDAGGAGVTERPELEAWMRAPGWGLFAAALVESGPLPPACTVFALSDELLTRVPGVLTRAGAATHFVAQQALFLTGAPGAASMLDGTAATVLQEGAMTRFRVEAGAGWQALDLLVQRREPLRTKSKWQILYQVEDVVAQGV
jgi:hypothetical protein